MSLIWYLLITRVYFFQFYSSCAYFGHASFLASQQASKLSFNLFENEPFNIIQTSKHCTVVDFILNIHLGNFHTPVSQLNEVTPTAFHATVVSCVRLVLDNLTIALLYCKHVLVRHTTGLLLVRGTSSLRIDNLAKDSRNICQDSLSRPYV